MKFKRFLAAGLAASMIFTMAACGTAHNTQEQAQAETQTEATATASDYTYDSVVSSIDGVYENSVIDTADMFTERDLTQNADLTDATYFTVSDGQNIEITEAGVYVLQGTAANVTVKVECADDSAKVQLVLDGVSITNESAPAIYVTSADKVFVTTTDGTKNTLKVTGTFVADGDTDLDGVIFSKDDLVLNGLGTLVISSTDHGVVSKDGLKVTGGSYEISTQGDGLKAHDYIEIAAGTFNISADDCIEAKDDDDDTIGYVYILGGTFNFNAADDGIHGTTYLEVDGGSFNIIAAEGLEATYVQLNGGDVTISATDDGINAAQKSTSISCRLDINGGSYDITMGQGDTDAVDVNGTLNITGGEINITAQWSFDVDGQISFTGGTVIVNGEQLTTITTQMMGGPGQGGMAGGQPGGMGGGPGMGGDPGGRGPWG